MFAFCPAGNSAEHRNSGVQGMADTEFCLAGVWVYAGVRTCTLACTGVRWWMRCDHCEIQRAVL